MRQQASRPSRRAVRLSLNWQAPTLISDNPERERPGAWNAEAEHSKADSRAYTRSIADPQGQDGDA